MRNSQLAITLPGRQDHAHSTVLCANDVGMGLDEALRQADPTKAEVIFDDLFGCASHGEDTDMAFYMGEQDIAYGRYPILRVVRERFEAMIPDRLEAGHTSEQIEQQMTGMDVIVLILAACASAEASDTQDIA